MKFSECREGMRVRYHRPVTERHGFEGEIISVDSNDSEVEIRWDNGRRDVFNESIIFLRPIEPKVRSNMADPEGYAFFAKVPEGCCPCGILRKSGRCNFH